MSNIDVRPLTYWKYVHGDRATTFSVFVDFDDYQIQKSGFTFRCV